EGGLRRRRVRRVHRAARRRGRQLVPRRRRPVPRSERRHRRGSRACRGPACGAARARRVRRRAVRDLHAGHRGVCRARRRSRVDHRPRRVELGRRIAARDRIDDTGRARPDPRAARRQHLPVHRLSADRRRRDGRGPRGRAMTSYLRPRDLEEAVVAHAAYPEWMVLAGGADLMVNAPQHAVPPGIIDLWRLHAICFIRVGDREIAIGAGTTWHEVERHPAIRTKLLPLALAAREIGALQIQARATLGGNVGTSSPVGDSLPVLLALDAELEVASLRGARRVPYRAWCTGYRTTELAPDALIVAAHIPVPG